MLNFNLTLQPKLGQQRQYPDMTRLFAAMEQRKRQQGRQPLRLSQHDIDRIHIDSRRYFAHRCQISTSMVWNTHWERLEFPRRVGVSPWLCIAIIGMCLYGLWRFIL